ncbi:DUF5606 family protein [Parafilimonas sp.]|uniref:DUF5606 family protein n=1 Tax=Parafilimonas sp. TaxID=1969739 RepID=UPI003F7FE213
MEYSKLISVTGLPGLFELVASKNDGAIVRSLDDKTTRFVSSRIHNFSHLESIEVYTEGDNVNLADVFLAMKNSGEALPNEKEAPAVKKYFEKVYPTMDFERVYASDMKKMVKWFDVLNKNDIEIKVSEETPEGEEEETEEKPEPNKQPEEKPKVEEPVATPAVEAKPKKAKAAKAKKEEPAAEDAAAESKPKAAKKKAAKK